MTKAEEGAIKECTSDDLIAYTTKNYPWLNLTKEEAESLAWVSEGKIGILNDVFYVRMRPITPQPYYTGDNHFVLQKKDLGWLKMSFKDWLETVDTTLTELISVKSIGRIFDLDMDEYSKFLDGQYDKIKPILLVYRRLMKGEA